MSAGLCQEGQAIASSSEFPPVPPDGRILFFARDRAVFGFLSHFHVAPVLIDGEAWPTAEHYYQAHKSLDPAYRRAIRACDTPAKAKHTAATPSPSHRSAKRSWFLATGRAPRPDWYAVKRDVMRRAEREKYAQHPDLAARLLATGDAEIVEDSPHEPFWGIGADGAGENWAGRIIMEARDALSSEADEQGAVPRMDRPDVPVEQVAPSAAPGSPPLPDG